jgi:hypothetical protein
MHLVCCQKFVFGVHSLQPLNSPVLGSHAVACTLLNTALLARKPAREVLKAILREHPDIVNDPVYLAALRNVHVDTSMIR